MLIAGLSGSGKSTLALALGKALGWPVIDKDTFVNTLLEQDVSAPGAIAHELMLTLGRDLLLEQGCSVILDCPARLPLTSQNAALIATEAGADLKVVLCLADQMVRNQRIKDGATDATHSRYKPHSQSQLQIDSATDGNGLRQFVHLSETALHVDTTRPLTECVSKALDYVSVSPLTPSVLSESTLVLMAGFSGAGKSALASGIGKQLSWPVLDRDLLWYTLYMSGVIHETASTVAYDVLFAAATDLLGQRQATILDCASRFPLTVQNASAIASANGAKLKVVLCYADNETRNRRVAAGRASKQWIERRPVGMELEGNGREYFGHLPQNSLAVDTRRRLEDVIPEVLTYLSSAKNVSTPLAPIA